uniref:Uncharacterized protein n=1 Tax=Cucumis melo TaxID=3656 RepID=A0A9I9CTT1_CUCME
MASKKATPTYNLTSERMSTETRREIHSRHATSTTLRNSFSRVELPDDDKTLAQSHSRRDVYTSTVNHRRHPV